MAFHRKIGQSTQPELRAERRRRDARDVALKFSRELPTRQHSPLGELGIDKEAIMEAFRFCYEALRSKDDR